MRPDLGEPESSTQGPTPFSDSSPITRPHNRCRVPGCPNPECKLSTHQKYNPNTWVTPSEQGRKQHAISSDTGQMTRRTPHLTIQNDGVDGLPALPGNEQDPELRSLFHHFFTSVFEPLAHIFRGPTVNSMSEYKERMLATALKSEGYCMGLIVQSQTDLDIRRREAIEPRTSLEIYTKATAAFRKQIEAIEKYPHPLPLQLELALLTLCTLVSYDGVYRRDAAIEMHWTGLQHLVARRGGLHCVTMSLAYVVHVDRMCAQRLNKMPAFSTLTVQLVPLWKPQLFNNGSVLRKGDGPIRDAFMSHVVNHCIDTCDLLDLWETSHRRNAHESRNTHSQSTPSLEYLYYLRDRVDEQFSVLHADLWNQNVRDRCLLWATRIVEYPVTWSNQIPTMNVHFCDHLLEALRTQDLSKIWEGNTNMLVWILFALATLETYFTGRDQVITYLRVILRLKHGELHRSDQWWQAELENVQNFVWSNTYNTPRFYDVCLELQIDCTTSSTIPDFTPLTVPSSSTPPGNAYEEKEGLESGPAKLCSQIVENSS